MAGTSTLLIEKTRLQKYIGDASSATGTYLVQHINDAYRTVCEAADWPWLHYTGAVNLIAAYTTGTITLTAGATSLTTTGTWATSWSPVRIRSAAGHDYLATYGGSAWTIDRVAVEGESAVTYTLYKDRYPLATNLRSMYLCYPTIAPDYPCKIITPTEMSVYKSAGLTTYTPVQAVCFGDADTTSMFSNLEVYPVPAAVHSLHYKGYKQVADLSADVDVFLFPGALLGVFRHLALSYTFDWRGNTERSTQEYQRYEIELAKAINRSDPSAGAGDQFILDPRVFSPRNFRDERARAGIG
jgi:hypothetical protein